MNAAAEVETLARSTAIRDITTAIAEGRLMPTREIFEAVARLSRAAGLWAGVAEECRR